MANDKSVLKVNRRTLLTLASSALLAPPAMASIFDPTPQEQQASLAALKTPGHALLVRHALAPGHNDPAGLDLSQCHTQRNLDDAGRAQAVEMGAWLRAQGVTPSMVYSSQWCRCMDTARLMGFEPIVPEVSLNSIADMPGTEASKLRRLRRFLGALSSAPGPALLMTHSTIATHMIGGLLGSGEGAVVRLGADGAATSIGRVLFGMERV